jgi:hypothetical protein
MMSLLAALHERLTPDAVTQLARRIGADPGATGNATAVAVPLLLSALAAETATGAGAMELHGAVARDHDGRVLDDAAGHLAQADESEGRAILSHVLRSRQLAVEEGLADSAGLSRGQAGGVLASLAPLVLAAVGRMQREQRLDPTGLSAALADERARIKDRAPGALGALEGLLDGHAPARPGDAAGDVGSVLSSLFAQP